MKGTIWSHFAAVNGFRCHPVNFINDILFDPGDDDPGTIISYFIVEDISAWEG